MAWLQQLTLASGLPVTQAQSANLLGKLGILRRAAFYLSPLATYRSERIR